MRGYLISEEGAAAAEYAVVLAILGAGLALAVMSFRNAAKVAVENTAPMAAAATGETGPTGTGAGSTSGGTAGHGNGIGSRKTH